MRRDIHASASGRKTRFPDRRKSRAPRRTRLLGRCRDPLSPPYGGSLSIPARLSLPLLLYESRTRLHRLAISAERLPGIWKRDARLARGIVERELGSLLAGPDGQQ